MEQVYVLGHKKPDTDSVTSAIALSYLKNQLGMKTVPRVLGHLNNETKYVLEHFQVAEPEYLTDVKVQLQDIHYQKDFFLSRKASIYDSYLYMSEKHATGLPIVNPDQTLYGFITIKDLARYFVDTECHHLATSYTNILKVLEGQEIIRHEEEITGELLVASYRSTTFLDQVKLQKDTILIVGDRHSIIEYAVNTGIKMLIVVGDGEIKEEHLKIAREKKMNIIRTSLDTLHTAKLITLSNYVETMVLNQQPISFEQTDFLDDFIEVSNKLKHTNYPILDKKGRCLGLLRLADLNEKERKQVILVDHNEKAQSADGIEEADVLEVVDHHNLGSLTTSSPISFRCMAVGSTNTILYDLYLESRIAIPKEIAGLMLSGILSDTLLFQSPTTTEKDKEAALALAGIAEVDYQSYGMDMLRAGTSLKGKTKEEILYTDFKIYPIGDKQVGIGQIFTFDFEEIRPDIDTYVSLLNQVAEANNYYMVALYVTDVIQNGSYVIYSDKGKDILERGYMVKEVEQGHYFADVVSRKKQMVPNIIDALDGK